MYAGSCHVESGKRPIVLRDFLEFKSPPGYPISIIDLYVELNGGIGYLRRKIEEVRGCERPCDVWSKEHYVKIELREFELKVGPIKFADFTGNENLRKKIFKYYSLKREFDDVVMEMSSILVRKDVELRKEIALLSGKKSIGINLTYPDNSDN